jgi:hypothetical protein
VAVPHDQRWGRGDFVGDLARDAYHDRDWPRDADLLELHRHLDRKFFADPDAHAVLDRAWIEWRLHELEEQTPEWIAVRDFARDYAEQYGWWLDREREREASTRLYHHVFEREEPPAS